MASMISKNPFAGFAAAIVFGFLGLLLIKSESSAGPDQGLVVWLFRIVGWFLLFVALGSVITALSVVRRRAGKAPE